VLKCAEYFTEREFSGIILAAVILRFQTGIPSGPDHNVVDEESHETRESRLECLTQSRHYVV